MTEARFLIDSYLDWIKTEGIPIVEDPPLARSLHASVEVGQEIPEAFFQAVAQLLAFVYRVAGRRAG